MKTYFKKNLSGKELEDLTVRGGIDLEKVMGIVKNIEKNILERGDTEIRDLTEKFDKIKLEKFCLDDSFFENIEAKVGKDFEKTLKVAAGNIQKFHESQITKTSEIETSKGVTCWRETRAIENVGLYIPGGTAPLFSTILMTVIPAKIAGCKNIILCTPPNPAPEILYTAKFLGIKPENIFQIGGAQAIFAMAQGTDQIPKMDKIFGPGNSFVMAAKMLASQYTAIDMPAGPSEVLVMADKNAEADFVAADLLSQAEHGADSQCVLVTDCEKKAEEVMNKLFEQLEVLDRKAMTGKSLENSFVLVTDNLEEALDFSNLYAPEHLILNIENPENYFENILNAGSVFVGSNACESFGDYASGTNHVLPTSGWARSFSGVSLDSFVKKITFQKISDEGVKTLGPVVELLAEREDLQAHKNAVSVRLKKLNN